MTRTRTCWLGIAFLAVAVTACADGLGSQAGDSDSDSDGSGQVTAGGGIVVSDPGNVTTGECDWPQIFGTRGNSGSAMCSQLRGLRVDRIIVEDADAADENAVAGFLQIHEPSALVSGDYVVFPQSRGFTATDGLSTKTWDVRVMRWVPHNGAPFAHLEDAWSALSDWQGIDQLVSAGTYTAGYIQLWQPVISNGSLYMPMRSGSVMRRDLATGSVQAVINPFAGTQYDGDRRTIIQSALKTDQDPGNASPAHVVYTVTAFPNDAQPFGKQPRESWLVEIDASNAIRTLPWSTLVAQAHLPLPGDLCERPFFVGGLFPTGPGSRPPMFPCGTQRPATNAPVAFTGAEMIAYSYANNELSAAYLVHISTAMTATRADDLRGHLHNGCGRRLRIDPAHDSNFCAAITANGTTNLGNDPDYNGPVRIHGMDLMDNAPSIGPNGDIAIGGYDGGFSFAGEDDARGSGMSFPALGAGAPHNGAPDGVAVNEQFFWEMTPAFDGSQWIGDRDLYSEFDMGVARWSPAWDVQNIGQVKIDTTAIAIDPLDAHVVFDNGGNTYSINGDGHLYRFAADGRAVESVELTRPDGSAYSIETLSNYMARDRWHLYPSYGGHFYVISGTGVVIHHPEEPDSQLRSPTVATMITRMLGASAKSASLHAAKVPPIN